MVRVERVFYIEIRHLARYHGTLMKPMRAQGERTGKPRNAQDPAQEGPWYENQAQEAF